jgi:transglutaminase-like putative cysteine protease
VSSTYLLTHTTSYVYDAEVTTSYGHAHLTPTQSAHQQLASHELEISPAAAEQIDNTDYFGNSSTFFVVREAHESLSVTARSRITVNRPAADSQALTQQPWALVAQACHQNPQVAEFTLPSPRVQGSPQLSDYANRVFTPGRSFGDAVTDLVGRIHQDFRYRSGATTVVSGISELLASRAGVCQDFAHLAVGCLRSVGLAARYVSGYLETRPAPGMQKLQGADASHAWAAVFAPGTGWVDLDPTNNQFVDERYVVAAVGRDYGDVPPLKGVIVTGAKKSTMRVSVDVTRVE